MAPLRDLRVALLETRLAEEAADLVRGLGGVPYCVPAAREAEHLDRVGPFIDRLSLRQISTVVFLTGIGASALLREALRLGRLEEIVAALGKITTACRGPKPIAVLEAYGIPVTLAASEPYTTRELLDALLPLDLSDHLVTVVHHGGPSRALSSLLAARGARVDELSLYEWVLPDDREPLAGLIREVIEGRVDAVAFTNRVQGRHLFLVAAELGLTAALTEALNTQVIVAAVGPVCAEALQALDVTPDVLPARPTMAAMVAALGDYVELTGDQPPD